MQNKIENLCKDFAFQWQELLDFRGALLHWFHAGPFT